MYYWWVSHINQDLSLTMNRFHFFLLGEVFTLLVRVFCLFIALIDFFIINYLLPYMRYRIEIFITFHFVQFPSDTLCLWRAVVWKPMHLRPFIFIDWPEDYLFVGIICTPIFAQFISFSNIFMGMMIIVYFSWFRMHISGVNFIIIFVCLEFIYPIFNKPTLFLNDGDFFAELRDLLLIMSLWLLNRWYKYLPLP